MKLTTGYKKPIDSDGNVLLAGGGHKTIQLIINDYGSMSITSAITFSLAINADITGNADTVDGYHANSFAFVENTYGTTGNFVNGIDVSNYIARGDLGLVGFDNSSITVELYEATSGNSYSSSPTKTINTSDATYGVNFRKGTYATMHSCAAGSKLKIIVKSSSDYIKSVGIYVATGGKDISFSSIVDSTTKTGSFSTWGSWHIFSCMDRTPRSITLELNTTNVNCGVIIGGFRTYITNPSNLRFPGVSNSAESVAWGNITEKPDSFTPSSHTHTKSQITDFPTIPSYSTATSNTLGLVKIGYAANNKNYPIQLSDDGKMYVHVPWTDTKRDITDSYSGTSSTISLSQKGGKDLYDALVNGYASSAGSSEYSNKLLVDTIVSSNATPDKFDSQRITGWIDENANLFNAEKFSGITVKGLNNKYSSFWQLAGYSSINPSTHGIFFREASSDSTWKDWVQIITTENILSQTVSLAKILSYDNSIKLYALNNNQLNFGGTNNSTTIYFGYQTTDSRAVPTDFIFGGSDGSAKITASGFAKKGINDSNVLLGAGGHKALAQFVLTSGDQSISGIKTFNDTIKANRAESTTGFFLTSDFRKKNILGNINEYKAYDFVKNCKPIVYELKDDETHDKQLGLIAQEVEEYFPELVITDENGFKSMDYSRLSVVLFTLLKDLIKRNKL